MSEPQLMQCHEVLTPLGLVAFFVLLFVLIVACGLVSPWLGVAFERYTDWVAKKTGGHRG